MRGGVAMSWRGGWRDHGGASETVFFRQRARRCLDLAADAPPNSRNRGWVSSSKPFGHFALAADTSIASSVLARLRAGLVATPNLRDLQRPRARRTVASFRHKS
jgi:hypothetical protein